MASNVLNDVKKFFCNMARASTVATQMGATFGFNKNLFIGREPNVPENCVTIYPTGGFVPDQEREAFNPTIQIRVRNVNWETGYKVCDSIITTMHRHTTVLASTPGKCFAIQSVPIYLGPMEDGDGHVFVANFRFRHVQYK